MALHHEALSAAEDAYAHRIGVEGRHFLGVHARQGIIDAIKAYEAARNGMVPGGITYYPDGYVGPAYAPTMEDWRRMWEPAPKPARFAGMPGYTATLAAVQRQGRAAGFDLAKAPDATVVADAEGSFVTHVWVDRWGLHWGPQQRCVPSAENALDDQG